MRRRIQRNDARFEEGQVGVVAGEKTEHQNHSMLLASFIVKGWDGVLDAEGSPIKYSPSVAAELLENNIEFFIFVLREGALAANDAAEERAESVGKPLPRFEWEQEWGGESKKRRAVYARLRLAVPDEPERDPITAYLLNLYRNICRGRRYIAGMAGRSRCLCRRGRYPTG
jgi:hypothetical protein